MILKMTGYSRKRFDHFLILEQKRCSGKEKHDLNIIDVPARAITINSTVYANHKKNRERCLTSLAVF